jgi:hypothetical protein
MAKAKWRYNGGTRQERVKKEGAEIFLGTFSRVSKKLRDNFNTSATRQFFTKFVKLNLCSLTFYGGTSQLRSIANTNAIAKPLVHMLFL